MPVLEAPNPVKQQHDCSSCLVPVAEMLGDWWLCQTLSGPQLHEMALARELELKRADYFVPLRQVKVRRRNGDGRVFIERISRPLFPGYLFLNGSLSRDIAARSKHKIAIIPMNAKYQVKLKTELESLAIALDANPSLGSYPEHRIGDRVRVTAGPMMGAIGVLERTSSAHRVWLNVEILGRGTPTEVPAEWLEAAD